MSSPNIAHTSMDGKVVVITGASRGIGAASARAFALAGARVVLAARDEQALEAVARDIRSVDSQALVVPTDTGDPAAIAQVIDATLKAFGRLDAAFNNAGDGHMPTPLADIAVEDFDRVVRVNLRGAFLAMKYEIPAMLASGGGAIVNMSSTAGLMGVPGIASYDASKHGIIGLTRTAAADYAQRNIRVNALAPGPILTHRLQNVPDALHERVVGPIPMHRLGRPEEVAATVVWLCSDQASYITGATLPVDGGWTAVSGR